MISGKADPARRVDGDARWLTAVASLAVGAAFFALWVLVAAIVAGLLR